MPPLIQIRNLSKHFGAETAVDNVSLEIHAGEFFALLGPSGCGKSTLLRIIAGFDSPSEGELLLDGEDMTLLPPNKRPVNMVFQSYAVFPHFSVAQNIAYGLKMQKMPREIIEQTVDDALAQVHLTHFKHRMPDQLSGGQQQRVALARALVKKPRVLLLDEPLSALDAKLREAMRGELVKLQHSVGVSFIMVTHDQSEAMAMADRVAVLDEGKLQQVDAPKTLYHRPKNVFVADFIGRINLFNVDSVRRHDNVLRTTAAGLGELSLPAAMLPPNAADKELMFAVRPENIHLSQTPDDGAQLCFGGVISQTAYQGECSLVEVALNGGATLNAFVYSNEKTFDWIAAGEKVWCAWSIANSLLIPKQ